MCLGHLLSKYIYLASFKKKKSAYVVLEAATWSPKIQISEWNTVKEGVFSGAHRNVFILCFAFQETCIQLSFCTAQWGWDPEFVDTCVML